MNGQDIPGFYYDAEKKKYFKIQSATASRDLDLKYSAQNLRKLDRQDRTQKLADARTQRVRKERVIRRHLSSLTQTCIEREIGSRRGSYYLQISWPRACMSGFSTKSESIVDRSDEGPIRLFDLDSITRTIYAVHGDNFIQRLYLPSLCGRQSEAVQDPWEFLDVTESPVSSVQFLPATGTLAIATRGPSHIQLSDPERDGPSVGQIFAQLHGNVAWRACARPAYLRSVAKTSSLPDIEMLAVAASTSIMLFTRSSTGVWDNTTTAVRELESDVLAISWLSYTMLALGCRNGKILLYDTRSEGSSHILTHPSPVVRIRRADDQTRLVVNGLSDTMVLYDIRAPRSSLDVKGEERSKRVTSGEHRRKRSKNNVRHWSQHIIAFKHSNPDDPELDVAVHERLGVVAAGQQGDVAIRVSNLWTGETLRELRMDKGKHRIMSLKWVDEENGCVCLWASGQGGIVRFGW